MVKINCKIHKFITELFIDFLFVLSAAQTITGMINLQNEQLPSKTVEDITHPLLF